LAVLSTVILVVTAQVLLVLAGCRQPSDGEEGGAASSDAELFSGYVEAAVAGESDAIDMYEHAEIPETEFSKLANVEKLRFLRLDDCPIGDEHMGHLVSISGLETVYLSNTGITDAGLGVLCQVESLKNLTLDGTAVTDDGLSHLQKLPNLEKLSLWRCYITDHGCESLARLTTLKQLSLDGTPVSDEGIQKLHGLKGLEEIRLWGTRVTENGIAALQQALPGVEIHR
jgi:hypothetical protein